MVNLMHSLYNDDIACNRCIKKAAMEASILHKFDKRGSLDPVRGHPFPALSYWLFIFLACLFFFFDTPHKCVT